MGNGTSSSEGYIEAYNSTSGMWGILCDQSFGIIDAHVVCKMLGFTTAIEALSNSAADDLYGNPPSSSNFVLDNLDCSGSEKSVFDCPTTGESTNNCKASGVRCSTGKLWLILKQFVTREHPNMISLQKKCTKKEILWYVQIYYWGDKGNMIDQKTRI